MREATLKTPNGVLEKDYNMHGWHDPKLKTSRPATYWAKSVSLCIVGGKSDVAIISPSRYRVTRVGKQGLQKEQDCKTVRA